MGGFSSTIDKFCLYIIIVVAIVWIHQSLNAIAHEMPVVSSDQILQPELNQNEKENYGENMIDLNSVQKALFKKLFLRRRREHLEAVKNLQKIDNYERQYKMINTIAVKMFDVIETNKVLIENFINPNSAMIPFSMNMTEEIKDGISSILENIAFFSDIVLNLPDITHRILKTQSKWNPTIHWSYTFLNKTRDWLDESTLEIIDLVLQELNFIKRKPDYFNPYRTTILPNKNENKRKRSGKKEKRKKVPALTKIDL